MRKLVAAILATLVIVACDSSTAPDLTTFAGNYALRSVNDTVLPYNVVSQTGYTLDIAADTLFLAVNGAFIDVTHYNQTSAGVVDFPADTLGGAWTVQGSTVQFNSVNGDTFNGTISGSTITILGSGDKAVYSK